jgi:hypothetical protein
LYSVLSICSTQAWTPASTARAGPFFVFAPSSRQEGDDQQNPGQVSETAMRLHRAHPEVVLGEKPAASLSPYSPLRPRDTMIQRPYRPLSSTKRFGSWVDPMTPKNSGKKRTPLGRPTLSQCY